MSDCHSSDMSVIIITPDNYETIRTTIGYLREQTVGEKLEVIIVAPSEDALAADYSELEDFHQTVVVEVGKVKSVAQANAVGIRRASAPVVAFIEEHSYPEPGWAEALIRAHQHSWAAVGPVVRNANPDSLISWADFIISYGQWMESSPAGVVEVLPGHNSSYKREILLEYGTELESILEAETTLHFDLREKGYQLYLEPEAQISHLGFSLLSSWLSAQFHLGRLFAANRANRWFFLRQLLYTGGTPLIPILRFFRILRQLNWPGKQHNFPSGALPLSMLGLVASALGEMTGYAFGPGNSIQRMLNLEFHRSSR